MNNKNNRFLLIFSIDSNAWFLLNNPYKTYFPIYFSIPKMCVFMCEFAQKMTFWFGFVKVRLSTSIEFKSFWWIWIERVCSLCVHCSPYVTIAFFSLRVSVSHSQCHIEITFQHQTPFDKSSNATALESINLLTLKYKITMEYENFSRRFDFVS